MARGETKEGYLSREHYINEIKELTNTKCINFAYKLSTENLRELYMLVEAARAEGGDIK